MQLFSLDGAGRRDPFERAILGHSLVVDGHALLDHGLDGVFPALGAQLPEIQLSGLAHKVDRCLHIPYAGKLNGYAVRALLLNDRLGNAVCVDSPADDIDNAVDRLVGRLIPDLGQVCSVNKMDAAAEVETQAHPHGVVGVPSFAKTGKVVFLDQHGRQCDSEENGDQGEPDKIPAVH